MSIEIPLSQTLTVEQAIAAANAAKISAQQALANIPAVIDAEVGPASAPYIAQAESARDAAVVAKTAAETARDNAMATERRMRQQSLGEFANDAAAEAWAAAQSPAITIITGTSYLNTTTDIFRYAVVSAGPTIVWHDVTEDEAAQAVLAQASATAAAASLSTMLTKLVGAFSTDPTYVGDSPPWVVGALYFNTLSNKLKVWTSGSVWAFYDAAAQTAATSAAYNATVATAALTLFQSYYCGASASDPTVDGAGNALTPAAFYFNTVSGKMRTRATGAWVDYDSSAQAALTSAIAQVALATAQAGIATTKASDASTFAAAALGSYNNTNALLSSVSASAIIAQQAANNALLPSLSVLAAAQRAIKISTALVAGAAVPYDTTKDEVSDWPRKCVSQSYLSDTLNTATRGSVAAVPAQMVVMGETTVLSVFMGTDGLGALWKSWTVSNLTCVGARSGFIFYGTSSNGIYILDLVTDQVFARNSSALYVCNNQNVSTFNQSTATWTQISASGQIANVNVNSIAATVLPLTQPNPLRFGLPNPTIAVGSAGVTGVIRADGVVSNAGTAAGAVSVAFDDKGNLWHSFFSGMYMVPPALYLTPSWAYNGVLTLTPAQLGIATLPKVTACGPGMVAFSSSSGLALVKLDPANPANSLYRVKTTTYDTGWLVLGKTVLAMAESIAALTTLVAGGSNNDFSGGNPGGAWSQTAGTVAFTGGQMTIATPAGGGNGVAAGPSFATNIGQKFYIDLSFVNLVAGTGIVVRVGTTPNGIDLINGVISSNFTGRFPLQFTATTATVYVSVATSAPTAGYQIGVNYLNIVACANDVSGSLNNPKVVGSISRAQVASGADLAGLTGWGVGNYATGAAIALGTADFEFPISIVGASVTGTQTYLSHGYYTGGAYSGARVLLQSSTTSLTATFHDGTNSASISVASALAAGGNYDVRLIYRSALSRFELWSNGVMIGTAARGSVGSLTNASANLFIGIDPALANPTVSTVILALIRAWTYATTPDQIAFMRADEKGRFAANAKELLSGANVQAVAFDPDTNQLAASNSTGGTDVFAGPGFSVRVANQKSTTGANLIAGSSLAPSTSTWFNNISNASVGNQVSAFASWGGGVGWELLDTASNITHLFNIKPYTANGSSAYGVAIPLKAASQGIAAVGVTQNAYATINLATGAVINTFSGASAQVVQKATGEWLAFVYATPTAGAQMPFVQASNGAYAGAGTAAIIFGKPMVVVGSTIPSAYVDGLSANDNHKAVAFAGGDLVVATGAGVDAFLAVKPGLRETAGGVGAPRRAPYDPTWGQFYGVTNDATPTVFGAALISEGKAYRFRATVVAAQWGGAATEKATYDITGIVSRDLGGNVTVVTTTTTVSEVTSTMDCIAQANTTAQTIEIKATGKAATRMAWLVGLELYDVGLSAAA